jgi:hypothetical protein
VGNTKIPTAERRTSFTTRAWGGIRICLVFSLFNSGSTPRAWGIQIKTKPMPNIRPVHPSGVGNTAHSFFSGRFLGSPPRAGDTNPGLSELTHPRFTPRGGEYSRLGIRTSSSLVHPPAWGIRQCSEPSDRYDRSPHVRGGITLDQLTF